MGFYENSLDAVINIPFKSSIANMFTGRWLEIILFFCGASTKRSHYICRLNRLLLFVKTDQHWIFFLFLTCKNSSLHWKNVNWRLLYKSAQKCQTLDSFFTSFLFYRFKSFKKVIIPSSVHLSSNCLSSKYNLHWNVNRAVIIWSLLII